MGDLIVKYNGTRIYPTPLISQNYKFLDNYTRWGNINEVQFNGVMTGINGTGIISNLTSLFASQFGQIDVLEGASSIYSWSGAVIQDITFPNGHFYIGTAAPYSIKFNIYNIPSGVINPVNEYSFSLEEGGLASVNHRISAKGLKTSSPALTNAINFVKNFTGRSAYTPIFVPTGYGVLLSISENIDRQNSIYSVNELYKYDPLSSLSYIEQITTNVSDIIDNQYKTIDVNLGFQCSPINDSLSGFESNINSINILNKLNSNFGFDTTFFAKTSFDLNRNSGASRVELKASYFSGTSLQDISGYFDYDINFDCDKIIPSETWRVDGEFVCNGPLEYKQQRLNNFKIGKGWSDYLTGLIKTSPIYSSYHDSSKTMTTYNPVSIQENINLATLKASLSMKDGKENGGVNQKYLVSVEPSRWLFEVIPSANIEGHYVIQDPQTKNRGKVKIDLSMDAISGNNIFSPTISGMMSSISNIYITGDNILVSENISTGILDLSYNKEWIGSDSMSSGILFTKVVGSNSFDYTRQPGFMFGY